MEKIGKIGFDLNSDSTALIVILTHDMRIVMILKPVQLVQMEDGEHDCQGVDEDPDGVQHIVAVRTLRPRVRIFFRSPIC